MKRLPLLPVVLGLLVAASSCSPQDGLRASSSPHAVAKEGASPPAATATTLTYLGVAGWSLTSSAGTLLVDPYLTRVDPADDSVPLVPDQAAIAAYAPRKADAILVGHSHYDHVLDVPLIAQRTGATVVGTESTANLLRASGAPPSAIRVARGGERFTIGPFEVRAVTALHSLTGQENVAIPRALKLPLAVREYGEGGTLQYLVRFEQRSIYFVGTANFIEEEVRGIHPDIAVVAVGLRRKIPDYTCRLLGALGRPKLVLPNHFDAFREPLRPGHMDPDNDTRADLASFAAEVEACAPGTRVQVPAHLEPIAI